MKRKRTSEEAPSQIALQRFKKNKPALFGLSFILICVVIAILGYNITPDSTSNANTMIPEIALQHPGFKQKFLLVKKDELNSFPENSLSKMFLGSTNAFNLVPIEGNIIQQNDSVRTELFQGEEMLTKQISYARKDLYGSNEGQYIISKTFWLGTDTYGRDILSRLLIGLRVSLAVSAVAVFISLLIGICLGSVAGYYQGKTDHIIMWLINVVWSIPTLLLVFGLTIALGKGFWQIFVAVGLTMWVQVARLVRGQVMTLRKTEYVEAAESLGFKNFRIIIRHILPNTVGPVLVIAASNFATAILVEAGLSFLGIGVQPPAPSWGTMIKENYGFIISSNPFPALVPGIAILLLVLAFNLLGNGLRDAVDVKTKMS